MSPAWWRWARLLGAAAILAALGLQLGAEPFLLAFRRVDPGVLVAGTAIAVVTTVAAAWRWRTVAGVLGVDLALPGAVAGYYRSQFLNSVLPGGVLGDVHRGVRHGRDAGDLARALRAVVWERTAGQLVQVLLVLLALLLLPSPLSSPWAGSPLGVAWAVGGAGLVVLGLLLVLARRRVAAAGAVPRSRGPVGSVVAADLRAGLLARRALVVVAASSAVAVAGTVATFLLAAGAVGVQAPPERLLLLALLVLLASSVPVSIAGWGPREGAAAWAFGAAGLGAAEGVSVAVVYGVLVLVASLPGGAVLLADRPVRSRGPQPAATALVAGSPHG